MHKNNVKISKYSLHPVIGITESTFFSLRELYAHLIIIQWFYTLWLATFLKVILLINRLSIRPGRR